LVELGRYLSVIAVLAGVILLPLIYRGTSVPAACRVWAGNRPALKDAAAVKARAGDRKSRIAGLFKKVKLFCNSTSTLSDGSRDYHFIYMLIFNVSGLLAAIFIFFGRSARKFFGNRLHRIYRLTAQALFIIRPSTRSSGHRTGASGLNNGGTRN